MNQAETRAEHIGEPASFSPGSIMRTKSLAEVKEYFPQYAALPIFPIFAALTVPDHVVKYCTRHRIYALGL
jgi:hypothetical protein